MARIRTKAVAALFFVVATATLALAQGSVQERVHYAINVPHEVVMGGYVLPAGKYLLHQANATDLNLFALYRGDDTKTPIALIRTTRKDYQNGEYPQGMAIRLEFDETTTVAHPVLRGWSVPGQDGWEIIAVDAEDDVLVRVP
jgi:hypothetical protein